MRPKFDPEDPKQQQLQKPPCTRKVGYGGVLTVRSSSRKSVIALSGYFPLLPQVPLSYKMETACLIHRTLDRTKRDNVGKFSSKPDTAKLHGSQVLFLLTPSQ